MQRKEPREATVEHAEWQAKMNEVAHLAEIIIGKQTDADLVEFKETGNEAKKIKLEEAIKIIKEQKVSN